MKKSALMVIDVQVGLFETPGFDLYREKEVVAVIKTMISKARAVDIPVVYIQHNGGTGSPLEKGTAGWQIHLAIAPLDSDKVVEKTTPDSFYKTILQKELTDLGINKLYMLGLQTEFCVDTTCRRAKSQGFENILIGDAHSTFDTEVLSAKEIVAHHNRTLTRFADVIDSNHVIFE